MKMAGIDKNLTRQEERSRQRKEAEYERRKREQTRKAGEASVSTWQESGSESAYQQNVCQQVLGNYHGDFCSSHVAPKRYLYVHPCDQ
ncbi:hypothetical protein Btru_072111 [Bulinus truncatus]|nr:hypothetical protein Btru_072111 [Bulinus truncatus]